MARAMVVVDVQRDFIEGGSLAVKGGAVVAHRIAEAIRSYKRGNSKLYDYFVATKDFHDPYTNNGGHFSDSPDFVDSWPKHCVSGTDGSRFAPPIEDVADYFDAVFYKGQNKPSYSGFEGRTHPINPHLGFDLDKWLTWNDVTDLTIVGIATEHCVKATAEDAIELGYDIWIPSSLTVAVGGNRARDLTILDLTVKRNRMKRDYA